MTKYTLGIELENPDYCKGCPAFVIDCDYDGFYCASNSAIEFEYENNDNRKRPADCPLQPVKEEPDCGDCKHYNDDLFCDACACIRKDRWEKKDD